MRTVLFFALMWAAGCSTAIKYRDANESDSIDSSTMKFRLTDSMLTFARDDTVVTQDKDSAQGRSDCPDNTTNLNWWRCFDRVSAHAAIAPIDEKTAKYLSPAVKNIHIATPADGNHLFLSKTSITGTPIASLDGLYYSQITVKYGSNVATIVSGAGAGAVTGFGVAGPYGAAAGFILGAIGAGANDAAPKLAAPGLAASQLSAFICPGEPVDFTNATRSPTSPSIKFPITIAEWNGRPFATDEDIATPPLMDDQCWHELPNSTSLGAMSATPPKHNSPSSREPLAGDGWLYRIVLSDKMPPPGTVLTETYFASDKLRHDFPYSSCRKVKVQITWWQELILGSGNNARVVTLESVIADPNYVNSAILRKGGVLTFRPDCGANVSVDRDTSLGNDISAVVSQVVAVYKEEQAYEQAHKK